MAEVEVWEIQMRGVVDGGLELKLEMPKLFRWSLFSGGPCAEGIHRDHGTEVRPSDSST